MPRVTCRPQVAQVYGSGRGHGERRDGELARRVQEPGDRGGDRQRLSGIGELQDQLGQGVAIPRLDHRRMSREAPCFSGGRDGVPHWHSASFWRRCSETGILTGYQDTPSGANGYGYLDNRMLAVAAGNLPPRKTCGVGDTLPNFAAPCEGSGCCQPAVRPGCRHPVGSARDKPPDFSRGSLTLHTQAAPPVSYSSLVIPLRELFAHRPRLSTTPISVMPPHHDPPGGLPPKAARSFAREIPTDIFGAAPL